MAQHRIKGLAFASIYADDFEAACAFYSDTLGLKKQYDMGDLACFFELGDDTGLYLQGGNRKTDQDKDTVRAAFVFAVESASATWAHLQQAGVRFVHDAPMHMGGDSYWFQFLDPAGNVLEALGGE